MPLPEDIVTKVLDDFGEDDGLLALNELKNLRHGDHDRDFSDRILRSIVTFARGSLKRLDQAIELTRTDWRDTLVGAEGWAHNALIMNFPFSLQLDQDVCRGWLIGLKVRLPWNTREGALWTIEAGDIRELELRRLRTESPAEGDVSGTAMFHATVRMLCMRGQPISSSPAFEIRLALWYSVDLGTKAFTLRRVSYNSDEIKREGKWE